MYVDTAEVKIFIDLRLLLRSQSAVIFGETIVGLDNLIAQTSLLLTLDVLRLTHTMVLLVLLLPRDLVILHRYFSFLHNVTGTSDSDSITS